MGGYIMQLQNYSINDGDGIRTIIFMAGCPLRCAWCANPEGQTVKNPMTRWVATKEIVHKVQKQEIFYRMSGGGITFSGGEATSQPDFLGEMTNIFYDKAYDLAIETSGQFDFEKLAPTLSRMNLIFMDLKHIDTEKHRQFTGIGNELILENIRKTFKLDVPLIIRIPTITGVNADDDSIKGTFEFLQENAPGVSVELLPYHRYGEDKYRRLHMTLPDSSFGTPGAEQLAKWIKLANEYGLNTISFK